MPKLDAKSATPSAGSLFQKQSENCRHCPTANTQPLDIYFAPPARAPSPGALPALLALALGFAISLALYAAFDASTRTGVHYPSAAGLSQ